MKFSAIAAIFALGAATLVASADTVGETVPSITGVPSIDQLDTAGVDEAILEEALAYDPENRAGGKSVCKRCEIPCRQFPGKDRVQVRVGCATCLAFELIANGGKRC